MTVNIAFSRKMGAVLVLLGITLAGALLLAAAVADRDAMLDELDAKTAFQGRSLAAVRRDAASTAPAAGPVTFAADSASLAAASVEAFVRAALADTGSVVLSSRAEVKDGAPGTPGGRIEVQAVARGPMTALQACLFKLEAGRPLVLLDSVDLRPADDEAATQQPSSPTLTATLTATTFWKPRAPGDRAREAGALSPE